MIHVQAVSMFLGNYFVIATGTEISDLLILGKDLDTWLIFAVVLLGLTSIGFIGTWGIGSLL